ncbi:MAG: prepilin peptidase [Proteobacteria bacterium]|nr:prepilin peptidase [Pseudomonadota bacterium]MBU1595677.1 prepilin peptidase [Pseudomonadota bacterium]
MDLNLFLLLSALLGLALGSFASCAGHRLARGGSLTSPARSFCPACGHTLTWRENIPLAGYLLQGGRCRFCAERIPLRYPLTELASTAFCLAAAALFGPTWHWFVAVGFATLLLILSLIDLETFLLPDALTLPGAAAAFLASALLPPLHTLGIGWRAAIFGALLGGGGLWLLAWAYRRIRGVDGLGLGDAKLMLLAGALLGPAAVPLTLFAGALLALPAGLAAARRSPRDGGGDGLRTALPFGPFLCAGALGYLLAGPQFLRWWLG